MITLRRNPVLFLALNGSIPLSERIFFNDIVKHIQFSKDTLIDINLTPFDLAQETLKPEEMNYWELDKLVTTMYENGVYNKRWVVDLYFKSAFAWNAYIN